MWFVLLMLLLVILYLFSLGFCFMNSSPPLFQGIVLTKSLSNKYLLLFKGNLVAKRSWVQSRGHLPRI